MCASGRACVCDGPPLAASKVEFVGRICGTNNLFGSSMCWGEAIGGVDVVAVRWGGGGVGDGDSDSIE